MQAWGQRTGAEGRGSCPALTGHLLFRSSGSWTSSPQPPPSATSMTCESGCARFQDVCRPCLPLGGQVRGGSRFSLLAKGVGGGASCPRRLCAFGLGRDPAKGGENGWPEKVGRAFYGAQLTQSCLLICFA